MNVMDASRMVSRRTRPEECSASGRPAKATELGGVVIVEPRDTPYGRMAAVRDPLGAGFALIEPAQPDA